MKTALVNTLFLFSILSFSQNDKFNDLNRDRVEYHLNNIKLIIYDDNDKFLIKDKPDFYRDERTDSLKRSNFISGNVYYKNNFIYLIDSNSKLSIKLRKINDYKVIVISKNIYFKQNEILYANAKCKSRKIVSMSWNNGLKHGVWSYETKSGYRYEIYDNGRLLHTYFRTYKQVIDSVMNDPVDLL